MSTTLSEQLEECRAGWMQRVPAERRAVMERHIAHLAEAGIARHARKVGDQAPPILLPDAQGSIFDVATLLAPAPLQGARHDEAWDAVERELLAIEALQTSKVLDLARRLKPGLTLEDVQNPHDFPELDDADWHYADGILTGMKSVTTALRALRQRSDEGG